MRTLTWRTTRTSGGGTACATAARCSATAPGRARRAPLLSAPSAAAASWTRCNSLAPSVACSSLGPLHLKEDHCMKHGVVSRGEEIITNVRVLLPPRWHHLGGPLRLTVQLGLNTPPIPGQASKPASV